MEGVKRDVGGEVTRKWRTKEKKETEKEQFSLQAGACLGKKDGDVGEKNTTMEPYRQAKRAEAHKGRVIGCMVSGYKPYCKTSFQRKKGRRLQQITLWKTHCWDGVKKIPAAGRVNEIF